MQLMFVVLVGIFALAPLQKGKAQDWTLAGNVSAVSDYRYRGVSLSDHKPALQGGLELARETGLYADIFVSTIDEYGEDAMGRGATLETDLTLGWTFEAGPWDVDLAIAGYGYPRGSAVSYVEFPVLASRPLGPLLLSVGAALAPNQAHLDRANRYGWLGLDWSVTDRTMIAAQVGHEDGAFARRKTDWSLGLNWRIGPVDTSLSYVDSSQSGPGIVLGLSRRFERH